MEVKEQILTLLKLYSIGEYETKIFCEVFIDLYCGEKSGYRFFVGDEKRGLDELLAVIERYTPYEEDLSSYPDYYVSNEEVQAKFDDVKNIFNLLE